MATRWGVPPPVHVEPCPGSIADISAHLADKLALAKRERLQELQLGTAALAHAELVASKPEHRRQQQLWTERSDELGALELEDAQEEHAARLEAELAEAAAIRTRRELEVELALRHEQLEQEAEAELALDLGQLDEEMLQLEQDERQLDERRQEAESESGSRAAAVLRTALLHAELEAEAAELARLELAEVEHRVEAAEHRAARPQPSTDGGHGSDAWTEYDEREVMAALQEISNRGLEESTADATLSSDRAAQLDAAAQGLQNDLRSLYNLAGGPYDANHELLSAQEYLVKLRVLLADVPESDRRENAFTGLRTAHSADGG